MKSAVLHCLVLSSALHAVAPEVAPAHLQDLLENPLDSSISEVIAGDSEIVELDDNGRTVIKRWVRRGGRLLLAGDAVGSAVRLLTSSECPDVSCPVGLGEVVATFDVRADRRDPPTMPGPGLVHAGARLSRFELPDGRPLREATAFRLLAYVALLGVVLAVGSRLCARWRTIGAACLVLVFGLWPWLFDGPAFAPDQVRQVDVVVDLVPGPALFWSVASIRADGRHETVVRTGQGAWGLHRLGPSHAIAAGHSKIRIEDVGDPTFAVDVHRGSEVTGLAWLADDDIDGRILVDVARHNGRVTGLVRNESAKTWTGVWLLLPGLEPLPLADLGPGDASVLDLQGTERSGPNRWQEIARSTSLQRGGLIEAALATVVPSLLRREAPVLLAWTDGPLRPARVTPGRRVDRGMTLLIHAGGRSS